MPATAATTSLSDVAVHENQLTHLQLSVGEHHQKYLFEKDQLNDRHATTEHATMQILFIS